MTLEVKDFMKSLKNDQFLFNYFYKKPSSMLFFIKTSTYGELFKAPEFKIFFLNNLLLDFLAVALEDEEFIDRLNENSITSLSQFISENQEFISEYEELKSRYGDNFIGTKELDKYLLDEGDDYSVSFFHLVYIEWKRDRVPKNIFEKAEGFNMPLAKQIINFLAELDSKIYFSNKCRSESKMALERVYKEGLLSSKEYYLYPKDSDEEIDDLEWFYQFVCNNEFLDVVEKLFLEGKLSGIALGNAIDIIERGISIKTFSKPITPFQTKLLGEEFIKAFNLERAKEVISKLAIFEIYSNKRNQVKPQYLKLIRSNNINEQES